ncbi:MAG: ribonuclease HII [Flavobacteriales bacterium]|nr:ribonuclease HII [Flavobacteriales bacterium]
MSLKPYLNTRIIEAGCDEAGRGCLAGPVSAAAVILPRNFKHPQLNDSKQLTERQREILRPIIEREALAWEVAMLDNHQIDEINILQASISCMHKALNGLMKRPDALLIDGNRFRQYEDIKHYCIIKGDGKYMSIAAASILAKTHRDEYMLELHAQHPEYGWNQNKGYPTKKHRAAIAKHGPTDLHRTSFRLLPDQEEIMLKSY